MEQFLAAAQEQGVLARDAIENWQKKLVDASFTQYKRFTFNDGFA